MPPHREGGQRQYVDRPVPVEADTLAGTLDWMLENLDEDLSVDELAAAPTCRPAPSPAGSAPRPAPRRTTGSPASGCSRAQRLLEETDQPVEAVADLVGFGSASVLRHHFTRRVGTTPQAYRRTFSGRREARSA